MQMFQSLTGRLQTVDVDGCADDAVEFQSLTGRLQTLAFWSGVDDILPCFNPSQVGYKPKIPENP